MLHIRPSDEIEYPTSDGEPMGETDLHRQMMADLIEALRAYYEDRKDVYTSGNLLLLYEEGKPNSHISPDVFVALGVPAGERENYKIWEEGKAPDLVIEVTSKSTKIRDIGFKKGLYEALGVREYLLFDPRNEYLKPRFQVYRLEGDLFVRVLVSEDSGFLSEVTGLRFQVEENQLRIYEPRGGTRLPTPAEYAARLREEAARADQEAARADQEAARAEREKARAEQLEEELRNLKRRSD